MSIKETCDNIKNILTLIMEIIVTLCFIFSVISALIHKKRYGSLPYGQGYGRK